MAERVLDARFLGGILSPNSNKVSVKSGDEDMYDIRALNSVYSV